MGQNKSQTSVCHPGLIFLVLKLILFSKLVGRITVRKAKWNSCFKKNRCKLNFPFLETGWSNNIKAFNHLNAMKPFCGHRSWAQFRTTYINPKQPPRKCCHLLMHLLFIDQPNKATKNSSFRWSQAKLMSPRFSIVLILIRCPHYSKKSTKLKTNKYWTTHTHLSTGKVSLIGGGPPRATFQKWLMSGYLSDAWKFGPRGRTLVSRNIGFCWTRTIRVRPPRRIGGSFDGY